MQASDDRIRLLAGAEADERNGDKEHTAWLARWRSRRWQSDSADANRPHDFAVANSIARDEVAKEAKRSPSMLVGSRARPQLPTSTGTVSWRFGIPRWIISVRLDHVRRAVAKRHFGS